MKQIYLFAIALAMACSFSAFAQLPDGSIAPDWTATDINGVEHHMYDYLGEGKMVIIDFFTVWCSPCWSYHNNGILDEMWEQYGPDGTNQVMIFQIETDRDAGMDELQGNGNTQGNWIEGVAFPTIDDLPNPNNSNGTIIGDVYELGYIPTIYVICPSRVLNEDHYEDGYMTVEELHEYMENCGSISETFDVAITGYLGENVYCNNGIEEVPIAIQNLGMETLTQATIQTILEGSVISTTSYTEELPTYELDTVYLEPLTNLPEEALITFKIVVDGDTDPENDEKQVTFTKTSLQSELAFTVEILTDNYPEEISFDITDDNGNLIFESEPLTSEDLYTWNITVEEPSCLTLNIYDEYGDGILGGGYIRLSNTSSEEEVLYIEGSSYSNLFSTLFMADGTSVTTYAVTFNITSASDNSVIEGATVLFNNESKTTDSQGTVSFTNIEPVSGAAYSVSAEDFSEAAGTLDVTNQDVTIDVSLTPTSGINSSENIFVAYPNPVKNTLTVQTSNMVQQISLLNTVGQIVYTVAHPNGNEVINMSLLPTGLYILQARSIDGKVYNQKLIKQ